MMELVLLLEKKVIMLKDDALKTFQIALAGMASDHLQELLESAFGYLESWASTEWGKQLEEIQQQFQENCKDAEPDTSMEPIAKPGNPDADPTPSTGNITPHPSEELDKDIECAPPAKQRCCTKVIEELLDLKPLKDYPGVFPSTSFPLSQTGVKDRMYRDCIKSEG